MNRFSFLTQDADQSRLPVALLSGFLGSGKTTLINALLQDPRMAGTAVAINEFGEIPLDRDLIDHGADKTVVMANGCLCCNLAGDMEDAVMRLFSRRKGGVVPRFERLIIEPSGLADPAPIAQAILRNPMMSRVMRLESIATTVDSVFGETQSGRHPEFGKQVALADCLVLTKTDLAASERVERLKAILRDRNPSAPIVATVHGAIDAGSLFSSVFFDRDVLTTRPRRPALFADNSDPAHLGRHAVVSLTADQPLDWHAFDGWLRRIRISHAENLLRVKGMMDIGGVDGPVVIQGIHHVLDAPVELDGWPAGERRSRLVLIGDSATIAAVRGSWAAAFQGMIANR